MKKIIILLACVIGICVAKAYAQQRLALERIASNNLPNGIIENNAVTPDWAVSAAAGWGAQDSGSERLTKAVTASAARLECEARLVVNPTFSPSGERLGFTYRNDLYVYDLQRDTLLRLTFDGSDVILNGYASWVYYEEILGRASKYKAFWWSPDSRTLAFYRFDDSEVPMFPIYDPAEAKGQIRSTHYPMAGEKNPEVKVGFAAADGSGIVWADFNEKDDQYFGIPFWNSDASQFIVPWMPRVQQDLLFYSVDPVNGSKRAIYKEHQDTWIDWPEQMLFTKEGFYMVRDFTMWEQIYFQSFDGKQLKAITSGNNWGINMLKIDPVRKEMYFTAKREISTRRDIYKVSLQNGKITRLSEGAYSYAGVVISDDFKKIYAYRSNAVTPYQGVEIETSGKRPLKVLWDQKGADFEKFALALPKMVYIKTPDGYTIPAKITFPVDLDTAAIKKYPVIVDMYGGPNTPQVADEWGGLGRRTQWWANQGVIQITIDHRGSGHSGKEGCNFMYRNFFSVELQDFIEWAKYLRSMPFVNPDKIGIQGFSYGGSMATLCTTEGCEYFKYGIAGGGVYDYMLYDSHYTERFMDTPARNPEGYKRTIMAERIAKSGYKGDSTNFLMLTHGAADDNVHIQNTMSLVLAMQKTGRQFGLMIYPKQLHGYRGSQGKFSSIADYAFWYRCLLNADSVPEALRKAL